MRFYLKYGVLFAFLSASMAWGQDSTRALAEILAQKGVITAEQLARVERAGAEEGVRLLAAMLADKGILTPSESARFAAPAPAQAASAPAPVVAADARTPGAVAAAPARTPRTGTLTSSAPVTFYGTLLWDGFYDTGAANNEDIPLYASKTGADPFASFGESARSTRLGMRIGGPEVAGAALSGQVEFDFNGGKTANVNGMNMDLIRLRFAFARLDWKHFAIETGQDWSIFAGLNPISLASYSTSSLAASGNLWIRAPQFRVEWRAGAVLLQAAASDSNIGDNSTSAFATSRTPGIGERGHMPSLQTRVALSGRIDGRTATVGLASDYGRGKNTSAVTGGFLVRPVDSWGVAADYILPLTGKLTLTGEGYEGRALGIFSSASGEAVLPIGTPGEHGVESRGGWTQAQIAWSAHWQTNLTYGLDAMNGANLRSGDRSKNQSYMTNLMFKPVPRLTFAWEWRRILTNFQNQKTANATIDNANMAVAYSF